jgi:methionyl-tRNA formyltransferase
VKRHVLYLGPPRRSIVEAIERHDTVAYCDERLQESDARLTDCDFIVSYGYSYLLQRPIVKRFERRAINLHIALLPWNRGADPNLWSYLENTPKGVSIHFIDEGLDTGDVLAQSELALGNDETLRSSYEKLSAAIEDLFKVHWPAMRLGDLPARRQASGGSFHRKADRKPYDHLLVQGWDTPVSRIAGLAAASGP